MASAFHGVRVIDACESAAGSMAAMLLGDFGADVLRIAPPGRRDDQTPPGAAGWNRNKHRLDLDLTEPEDRARFEGLLDHADVMVFDHGPALSRRLGLQGAALTARRPRLIPVWTPAFGTEGDWSELPAHHGMLMGLGGAAFRQGAWGDGPIWHVTPITHYAQAILAAAAAGAALLARGRDGRGQAVTVSGLHAMSQVACPLTELGSAPYGRGSPAGNSPSYRLYRCGDGKWLFLGALFSHFFARAAQALQLSGADVYDAGSAIGARLRSAPRAHWLAVLQAHDVPAGPVERREDWLANDICRANDLRAVLRHPELGEIETPGLAARLEATPGRVRHAMQEASDRWLAAFQAPRSAPAPTPTPTAEAGGEAEVGLPLRGVRVLDLGSVIAGTYAATILANFGAEVVKVEGPEGDPFRFAMTGFINYNRGKRGLGLNLKSPAGRDLFLDLCRSADVVLDNYRLGVRQRLGIDHAAVRAVNARLISCSANTYGSRGDHAARPGFDPLIQAESGLMAAQGGDSPPVFHTIPVNDVATAAVTAFAIIAGLNARMVTGEGQTIETSLAASSTIYQFAELTAFAGRRPAPVGCRDCPGFAALDRYYPCADGWIALAASNAAHVQALAEALDQPAWLARWTPEAALAEPRDGELAEEIARALADRPRDAVLAALAATGTPAAPVLTPREAAACAFLWANGYYQVFDHPQWGQLAGSRGFADFGSGPARFDRLEPDLGEHGAEVLLEHGIDRERIVALARAGVIFRG
jgi:crotonobetainyl-CoA:carnitine CoA-transferase CaiB-like acyl-CoA transferase